MKTYFIKFVYDNGVCQERYSSIVIAENVDSASEHFTNYAASVYPSSDDMCTIEMISEMKDNDIMIIEGEPRHVLTGIEWTEKNQWEALCNRNKSNWQIIKSVI